MGREAYRSLYGDLTKLKDDSTLKDPAAGSDDDDELFELLLAVSDWVDRFCNRHFYPRVETLVFDGAGSDRLPVPDLISVASLAEDLRGDLSFEAEWDPGVYRLLPHNAGPEKPWGVPYNVIKARSKGGPAAGFTAGEGNFRVTGVWGYRSFAEDSGTALDHAGVSATDANIPVEDGGEFRVGQTIMVDSEQALVTAISGNTLTVARGLNGAVAAAHAGGSAIGVLRWPASVERAALIQTARIWTRAADFEPFYVDADVDTDVRLLLEPYRKPPG